MPGFTRKRRSMAGMSTVAPRQQRVDPQDLLDLQSAYTEEERLIQSTVRQFVGDRVLPDVEWFEEGTFPKDLAKEMGALGLLGMHLEGYGCAGTSAVAYGLACLELEAGDSGVRSFVSVQGSLAMFPIWKFGSEEQKQRVAAADGAGRAHRLLRPDRARLGQRPRQHAHHAPAATATTGCSTAPRCGSPTAASPTSPSSGPQTPTAAAIRGFIVPTRHAGLHGQRHPPQAVAARLGHLRAGARRTCGCPTRCACPACATSAVRCPASTRRATASSGARSARPRACYESRPRLRQARAPSSACPSALPAHPAQAGRDDGPGQQGASPGPPPGPA